MKVIYIAGPYRADTEYGLLTNIENARREALFVWKHGGVALCPHSNSAFFGGECPNDVWLKGGLELLSRCDAIYMIPGWDKSSGSKAELDFVLDFDQEKNNRKIYILLSREEVIEYLGQRS